MSYRDPGPLPVPSLELIDKTVACLDQSLIDGRGTTGRSLADAPIVVVHRGSRQRYTDPCGVWLIDRRRVGRVEANEHAPGTAGLLADADGNVLAEIEKRGRLGRVLAVVKNDRELARITGTWRSETIDLAASTRSWTVRWRRRTHDRAICEGTVLLASATGQALRITWRERREHTTAVWLHRDLRTDQRAVVLLALLRRLGPPTPPPAG